MTAPCRVMRLRVSSLDSLLQQLLSVLLSQPSVRAAAAARAATRAACGAQARCPSSLLPLSPVRVLPLVVL